MSESPDAREARLALYAWAANAEEAGRSAEVMVALAADAICKQLADLTRAVDGHAAATGRP